MTKVAELRREYRIAGLSEGELDPDPIRQFAKWFDEAERAELLEPNAMSLATVDADGWPSVRTVLLKGFDDRGFVFFTNYEGRKARAMAANPRAALCFPWLPIERQVLVEGAVSETSREETEVYFRSRPRESRVGAWASHQSAVVPSRAALEASVAAIEARFPTDDIPPPPRWGGYRVVPRTIEFWQGREGRMHDRLRYARTDNGWVIDRLAP